MMMGLETNQLKMAKREQCKFVDGGLIHQN